MAIISQCLTSSSKLLQWLILLSACVYIGNTEGSLLGTPLCCSSFSEGLPIAHAADCSKTDYNTRSWSLRPTPGLSNTSVVVRTTSHHLER